MKFGCKVMGPVPVVRGLGKAASCNCSGSKQHCGKGPGHATVCFPKRGDQDPLGLLPATILHLSKHTGSPARARFAGMTKWKCLSEAVARPCSRQGMTTLKRVINRQCLRDIDRFPKPLNLVMPRLDRGIHA